MEPVVHCLKVAGEQMMAEEPAVKLDYFEIVDRATLDPASDISGGALVAVVAYAGNTWLIDNIVVRGQSAAGKSSR